MPKIIDDKQLFRDVMQAVTQYGYAAATTKKLAKAAGIGEVTLFRKYGNKAQLVKQAMISLSEESAFEESVQYTGDIHGDLLRVVEAYQASAEERGLFFYTILIEASRHPELIEALAGLQSRLGTVEGLMSRYQAEGKLKPADPIQLLTSLIGPLIARNMMQSALKGMPLPPIDLDSHVANFIGGYGVGGVSNDDD